MANTHSTDLERSSSQYWSITDAAQTGLGITGDITFEAWIKLEQLPSTATVGTPFSIINKDGVSGTNVRQYSLIIKDLNDKAHLLFWDSSNNLTRFEMDEAFVSGDIGSWIHIAVSVDVSVPSATFYKGGSAKSTTTLDSAATSITDTSTALFVGARPNTNGIDSYFDGLIDDVRVWNDIRTSTEIDDNKDKELTGSEDNLQGYWKFNNDGTDETSNSNDLTNNNSATFSTDVPFTGFNPALRRRLLA